MRERPYLILHGTLATEMNDEKADQRFHGHSSDNAPRGGIRVYEEPEKPDFRFWIPFLPPKNPSKTRFSGFYAWFSTEKNG